MSGDVGESVGEVPERVLPPPGAAAGGDVRAAVVGGVEREPGDHDPRVPRVGVDGDPGAGPGEAPGFERPGHVGRWAVEACAVEDERHRARAVVRRPRRGERAEMSDRLGVGLGVDLVGGGDRELDRRRRVAGSGGGSVGEDARRLARDGRERRGRGELIARGGRPDGCVRLAGARERGRPGGDLLEQVAGAGVGRGGDVDVPDAPGVLVGAAFPVVDVDVSADDRAAGVAGVERAGWCRTGWAGRARTSAAGSRRGRRRSRTRAVRR